MIKSHLVIRDAPVAVVSSYCQARVVYGADRKCEYLIRYQHTSDMSLSMTVAEKVKALRLKKAWSQEQLAEVASISVRTVQRTEKGQKPGLETLSALASAFDVSVSELSEEADDAVNALDERISDARVQVAREIKFWQILATALLTCTAMMVINFLLTPESYWSIVVTAIWGSLVMFRGLRVFVIHNQLKSWQQRRLNKLLRPGTKKEK